jgi:hypothetical protein
MADVHINTKERYSNEELELIKKYYPDNLDLLEVLLKNRNRKSIILKAFNMGLNKLNNEKFSKEEDEILRKNYPSNGGKYLLSLLPHRKLYEIHNRAFKLGVAYLTYNENYFNKIDSNEKAYWLGFIYADGYITEKTNRFGIELNIKDKSHLQNFLDCIDSNQKIRVRRRENKFKNKEQKYLESCSFLLNNKNIHDSLHNLGVLPNKSKIIEFPSEDQLMSEYYLDFIRGVIDGDGTIGLFNTSNGFKKPHISLISASYNFISKIKDILNKNGIDMQITETKNLLFRLMSEKQETVFKLLELIYKNSSENTRLKRKYKQCIKICNYYNLNSLA